MELKNIYGTLIFRDDDCDTIVKLINLAIKQKIDLSSANLSSADLSFANLSYANLSYANLSSADLSSADLSSANLSYANLSSADLSSANLSSADLSSADLSSANLSYANLRSANLSSANLSYADLSSANLSSANLSYAQGLNKYLCTPLLILKDQPGLIVAYKLVKSNGEGPFNGGLIYEIGGKYEILDANTNEFEECGAGINLATLDWCMKKWKESCRILKAQFTAKDIASIPVGTDGKFRVFRCEIVGEVDLKEIGLIVEEEATE